MKDKQLSIIWFEQDLRLSDNPALTAAIEQNNILPIFILDEKNAQQHTLGGASRWWLHHSLTALHHALGKQLNVYQGDASEILMALCDKHAVSHVYWNRRYEPWRIARDKKIKQALSAADIHVQSFNGALLNEPWSVLKGDGSPYKIFTPYHKLASTIDRIADDLPTPDLIDKKVMTDKQASTIADLKLLPNIAWDTEFNHTWQPGELGAKACLTDFLGSGINQYREGRDFPGLKAVSKISPHIHFGEISPRQIINTLHSVADDDNKEHFKREIRWREFSYYLLFHWPSLPQENLKPAFNSFAWGNNPQWLTCWQQGLTGYPIVDAGMRELWRTGFMHNRVRMITASFLIKNLLVDWRLGASWFWDCLVDADLASNSASWQWVAGCGTDASPYFRIFNPITQGEKFDAQGSYTKHFIPELKGLPNKYLFRPWEAPEEVLKAANVKLGENYPMPIVDIKESRQKALDAYAMTKNQ